jgi:hypothetical protein
MSEESTFKAVRIIDDETKEEVDAIEVTTITKHTIPKDQIEKRKAEAEHLLSYFGA